MVEFIELINFDILIASFQRPLVLKSCLDSISSNSLQNLTKTIILVLENDIESINLINSPKYQSLNIASALASDIPHPGLSRNMLIKQATSPYLFFMDDDASLPVDYFDTAREIIKNEKPMIFGGPDQYKEKSEIRQILIGELLKNKFVMGPTFKRHFKSNNIQDANETNLTLCNLWIQKSIFSKYNIYFDEEVKRCEENLLIESFLQKGVNASYYGDLFVYHLRRTSLFETFKIQLSSGFARGICFHKDARTFKPFFLIPFLTGVLLLIGPIFFKNLMFFLILAHTLYNTYISYKSTFYVKRINLLPYSLMFIILVHIGFSVGLVFGVVKGFIKCKKS